MTTLTKCIYAHTHHMIRIVLCMCRCALIKWRSENSTIINIQLRNYLLSLSFSSLFFLLSFVFSFPFFCLTHPLLTYLHSLVWPASCSFLLYIYRWCHHHLKCLSEEMPLQLYFWQRAEIRRFFESFNGNFTMAFSFSPPHTYTHTYIRTHTTHKYTSIVYNI